MEWTVWCVFWICLFTYWTIKESIELLTYNKRMAIKDLVRKELGQELRDIIDEVAQNCYKNDEGRYVIKLDLTINDEDSNESD